MFTKWETENEKARRRRGQHYYDGILHKMLSSKHSDDGPMLQAEAAENSSRLQIEKFAVSNG